MLDNMKMLGALGALMKNKDKLAGAGDRIKRKLEGVRVTGSAGGGAVTAHAGGNLQVTAIEISPALANGMAADENTRLAAGNLIAEAVNDALAQAQVRVREAVDTEAKALGLDGIPDLGGLGGLLGGGR